jgi:hypothetical protein
MSETLKKFIQDLEEKIIGLGEQYQNKILNKTNHEIQNDDNNDEVESDDDNNEIQNDDNNDEVESDNDDEIQSNNEVESDDDKNQNEEKEEIDNPNVQELDQFIIKHTKRIEKHKIIKKYKDLAKKKTQYKSLIFLFFRLLYNHTNIICALKLALYYKKSTINVLQQKLFKSSYELNVINFCIEKNISYSLNSLTNKRLTHSQKINSKNVEKSKYFHFTKLCFFILFTTFGLGFIISSSNKTISNYTDQIKPTINNTIYSPNAYNQNLTKSQQYPPYQMHPSYYHVGTQIKKHRFTQKFNDTDTDITSQASFIEKDAEQKTKKIIQHLLKENNNDTKRYEYFMNSYKYLLSILENSFSYEAMWNFVNDTKKATPSITKKENLNNTSTRKKQINKEKKFKNSSRITERIKERIPKRKLIHTKSLKNKNFNKKSLFDKKNVQVNNSIRTTDKEKTSKNNTARKKKITSKKTAPKTNETLHEAAPKENITLHEKSAPKENITLHEKSAPKENITSHEKSAPKENITLHEKSAPKENILPNNTVPKETAPKETAPKETTPKENVILHEKAAPTTKEKNTIEILPGGKREFISKISGKASKTKQSIPIIKKITKNKKNDGLEITEEDIFTNSAWNSAWNSQYNTIDGHYVI